MTVCIIGAGAAGLLLVLLLQTHIASEQITIIDPHFDGGDLVRKWSNVVSNTPLKAAINAFKTFAPTATLPPWVLDLDQEQPTSLATLGRFIRETVDITAVNRIQGTVTDANYINGAWQIQYISASSTRLHTADTLLLATGGEPKQMDLPIPSIPLEVALDSNRLKSYILPGQNIVIFGTSHSGILVIKNVLDYPVKSLVAVYKGAKPFIWARDGEYDGLKLEAAVLADSYVATTAPVKLSLVTLSDFTGIIKATHKADWVIYATGFNQRFTFPVRDKSVPINTLNYETTTGKIHRLTNAWGFGLSHPSQAPDGMHFDVGIFSFMEHISKQIPSILDSKK
jgi:hypothetical protein